jgi:hypothetical protein
MGNLIFGTKIEDFKSMLDSMWVSRLFCISGDLSSISVYLVCLCLKQQFCFIFAYLFVNKFIKRQESHCKWSVLIGHF